MIRRSLRIEKEQELQTETEKEIKQELTLVAKLCEAKKEWKKFRDSSWKDIPKYTHRDYEEIYDDIWTREKYGEPDETLLKEIVALTLVECFSEDFRWGEGRIFAFARVSLAYQKNLIRWFAVNETYRYIKNIFDARTRATAIINRLVERLSELPRNTYLSSQTFKKLIRPFAKILNMPHPSAKEIMQAVVKIQTVELLKLNEAADAALRRMEIMLENLPNPDAVSCEQAMQRVIEMYERNLTEQDLNIPEDGAILDHILSCAEKCIILSPFVYEKILGKIEPALPKRTNDCKKAIEQARKLLVAPVAR